MKFIGFNFNKINIEKLSDKIEGLKINTKIDISEIKSLETDFFNKKEEIINIKFNYKINYDPDFAKIEFEGDIFLSDEPTIIEDILKKWENKKMTGDFKMFLFNIILKKSNLKALQLEDEMNLPLHLPFPTLKKEENKEKTN